MSEDGQGPKVTRFNDTVTAVDHTVIVEIPCHYVSALSRGAHDGLAIGAHMTLEEARALLAGLQEALS